MNNVNPGLINPVHGCWKKGRYHQKVSNHDYWGNTPLINKPWFINPGLTLLMINLGWLNYRGLYCQSIGNYHNPWRPNWMTANLLPILSVETHLVKAGISLKTFLAVKPSQIFGWLLTMTWRKSQITHWFSEQMEIIRIVHGPKLLWMIHDVTFVSPYYFVVCMLEPSESFFFWGGRIYDSFLEWECPESSFFWAGELIMKFNFERKLTHIIWFVCGIYIYGDGSKPWYLVNPKIAGIYGCSSP